MPTLLLHVAHRRPRLHADDPVHLADVIAAPREQLLQFARLREAEPATSPRPGLMRGAPASRVAYRRRSSRKSATDSIRDKRGNSDKRETPARCAPSGG
jgi:hypothetical protein